MGRRRDFDKVSSGKPSSSQHIDFWSEERAIGGLLCAITNLLGSQKEKNISNLKEKKVGSSRRGSEKEQLLVSGCLLQHLLFWGRSRPQTRVVHKEFPACVTCTRQRSKWANPATDAPTDCPVTGTNILQNFRETEPISSGSMRVLCLLNTLHDYQRRHCSAQQLAVCISDGSETSVAFVNVQA